MYSHEPSDHTTVEVHSKDSSVVKWYLKFKIFALKIAEHALINVPIVIVTTLFI